MNLGTYDINIDFSKLFVHNNTSIYFKEGDLNTAKVRARLTMKNKPINIVGCNVTIRIEPTEGNTITDNATVIDPINGIIEVDFKSNALLEGTHLFEVWIIKDESIKKSGKIGYRVLDSIDDAGAIEGTNEYPILISLISDANKAIQDAKQALNIAKDMEANVNKAIGNTNIAISNAETATSNANSKITELDESKTEMIEKVDASIDTMKSDVNKAKEDMKSTTDAKVKEIDTAITNMNSSVEDAKSDMQATTDAKMQQVDNSIVTMKSDVETAKNEMASKADEKIADVDRAIAAGTVDLELKKARKDANGIVHDTLEQRLESDLIVGDKSLKDFVIDMNGMKETQDLEYETNTGYKICNDTQVGVIKDLKVYGKSEVNILNRKKEPFKAGGANAITVDNDRVTIENPTGYSFARFYMNKGFEKGKTYTFVVNVLECTSNSYGIFIESASGSSMNSGQVVLKMGINIFKLTVTTEDSINMRFFIGSQQTSKCSISRDILVLEGDCTQNPPSYFEGISSVGNRTPLEVSTRKEDGNLFDGEFEEKKQIDGVSGIVGNSPKRAIVKNGIFVQKGEKIHFKIESSQLGGDIQIRELYFYDLNGRYLGKQGAYIIDSVETIQFSGIMRIAIRFATTADEDLVDTTKINLSVVKSDTKLTTIPSYMCDKKPILFKDADGTWKPVTELRGIDLTACDTIEKGILTSKIGFETLVGTENIFALEVKKTTTTFTLDSNKYKLKSKCLCDKLPFVDIVKLVNEDIIGIAFSGTAQRLVIGVPNSIATTPEQLKTWLTTNNVSYLYEKTKIDTYEVNPLELESFDNITLWLILSGVIAPPASFKITSSLPNFVKNVDTRVKRMENDFYKYTVTQNRMQLGTTYSSDRTTFRVDTATFSTEKAKQDLDYDLFRLLKHNIIVGPQNYDKAEMENMMDFYVSVGKIDYNMWDELYMLIEEQYNPPVEEEAPVI